MIHRQVHALAFARQYLRYPYIAYSSPAWVYRALDHYARLIADRYVRRYGCGKGK